MPHSRKEGKDEVVVPWVKELSPKHVLDVGVGAGTYVKLLRDHLPGSVWSGVEVWYPYVGRYGLKGLYDELFHANFLTWEPGALTWDLVILGDVLEHVTREEAPVMWEKARLLGEAVLVVLPLDHFEQGEVFGNPHEAHLHHWSAEEVISLGGVVRSWTGPHKGVFLVEGFAK